MKLIFFLLSIIALALATEYGILFRNADLNFVDTINDWDLKGILGVEELQRVATETQAEVLSVLRMANVPFKSYYIANLIVVEDIKPELLARISRMSGVVKIEKYDRISIYEPKVEDSKEATIGPEWNVEMVKAPEAWAMGYNGSGIVIANLDTGVFFNHPDLLPSYRGYDRGQLDHNYNWFDGVANKPCKSAPCDLNGHGTHTMGTMVGYNPNLIVGVAPGAKWVACRSFATGSATIQDIVNCFEWFINPTDVNGNNPDPSKRPHLINHSWGSSQPYEGFRTAIQNLHKLGSLNFVSAGNSGPRCSSMGWPGGYNESFTSGATSERSNIITSFSSRGPNPAAYPYLKPDVVSPGHNINSCKHTGGYQKLSGTSMSSPCTCGAAAVVLQANPALIGKMEALKEVMFKGCKPIESSNCNSPQQHPNYVYGWGMVDIVKSL